MEVLRRLGRALKGNAGRIAWGVFESALGAIVGLLAAALYMRGR